MTTFPSLTPSSRAFTAGERAHALLRTMGGRSTQVRHSNVITGQRLSLTFKALDETQMLSIQAHYINRRGQFLTFALPSSIWAGVTDPTISGYSWRYVSMPKVDDIPMPRSIGIGSWYDVTIELEHLAEYVAPAQSGDVVIQVPPARVLMAALVPTVAGNAPVEVAVPAAAMTVAALAPTINIAAVPAAAVTVTAAMPDVVGDSVVVLVPASGITVAALVPTITGDTEPQSLVLLHMDGTNGGTTFTDSSSNGWTITSLPGGTPATTSTTQIKFGTASMNSTGAQYVRAETDAGANLGTGDFTVDFWAWLDSGNDFLDPLWGCGDWNTSGSVGIYMQSGSLYIRYGTDELSTAGLSSQTWHHIAIVRSSGSLLAFVNGVDAGFGSITHSASIAGQHYIGAYDFGGSINTGFTGYIDEFRCVKGTAIWTSGFTPPSSPYT